MLAWLKSIGRPDSGLINQREWRKSYFKVYTLVFIAVSFFAFSWYLFAGRTFIWNEDGWNQHYKALIYYARYLRSILKGILFEHRLAIPTWDFSFGEGGDVLQILHYYVIGDPFNLFSVLVPTRFMYLYYDGMILLRLYCAGIAFSILCFETDQKSRHAVLAGAVSYVFCYWALLNTARHPYFLNPMIYMPMLVLGVEKVLKHQRPYLFIITVTVSALSNFYFFYMLAVLTVIYVIVRLVFTHNIALKEKIAVIAKLGVFSIWGLFMASCIFLPVFLSFFGDARMVVEHAKHLFYPLYYYSQLPGLIVSPNSAFWTCLGFPAPVLLAVVMLLIGKKGEYTLLKRLLLLGVIMLLFPIFGQALNGFSYIANRWSWALALLSAYILVALWPALMDLKWRDFWALFLCLSGYFFLCLLLEYSRNESVFSAIGIAFVFLLLMIPKEHAVLNQRNKQQIALVLVIVSVINISFWLNSDQGSDYAADSIEVKTVAQDLKNNEISVIKEMAEKDGIDSFYRYSGNDLTWNGDILQKTCSTKYYWSISNPSISLFRSALSLREPMPQLFWGYDGRAALVTLASCYYYTVPSGDTSPIPYGFSAAGTINVRKSQTDKLLSSLEDELGTEDLSAAQEKSVVSATKKEYDVYRNDFALPFGYTYDSYIPKDEWDALPEIKKQEALLSGAVLQDYKGAVASKMPAFSSTNIDYSVKCNGSGVSMTDRGFVVTSARSKVTFRFDGLKNSELYLTIKGFSFDSVSDYDLYFGDESVDPLNIYNRVNWELLSHSKQEIIRKDKIFRDKPREVKCRLTASNGTTNLLDYMTEGHPFYSGRHDFAINLGYDENGISDVTMVFPYVGVYSFDSIQFSCLPVKEYGTQIAQLKEDVLTHVTIGTDLVSGTIDLDRPKLLCLSIPYSKGWTAYVDGVQTELLQANVMYMALDLGEGNHFIELRYHTPLLHTGITVSIISTLAFAVYITFCEKRERRHC